MTYPITKLNILILIFDIDIIFDIDVNILEIIIDSEASLYSPQTDGELHSSEYDVQNQSIFIMIFSIFNGF